MRGKEILTRRHSVRVAIQPESCGVEQWRNATGPQRPCTEQLSFFGPVSSGCLLSWIELYLRGCEFPRCCRGGLLLQRRIRTVWNKLCKDEMAIVHGPGQAGRDLGAFW